MHKINQLHQPCIILVISVICFWLVFMMHIPLYNVGGSGVNLPHNILTWIVVTFICGCVCVMNKTEGLIVTPFMIFFCVGAILLTAPVLWTSSPEYIADALPRFMGLWGGVIFYFCLLQLYFSERSCRYLLWCIALSALIEAGNVLLGLFFPQLLSPLGKLFIETNGRGSLGTFQQVNVTASWLATGLSVLMYLLFITGRRNVFPGKVLSEPYTYRSHRIILALASLILATLMCSLILTRSRTGWLGGGVCCLITTVSALMAVRSGILRRRFAAVMVLAPTLGVIVGLTLLDGSASQALAHEGSNIQRLLTLKVTWQMIMLHPFAGWGPGTFRSAFLNYMAQNFESNPSRELMGHPHNELLYQWFEGGAIALFGGLLIIFSIVHMLFRQLDASRFMLWSTLIPILLHTQTEFPFYYSAAHFIVILIILSILDSFSAEKIVVFPLSTKVVRAAPVYCWFIIVLASGILLWLMKVMSTGFVLSEFESGRLMHPDSILLITPPVMTEKRFAHDRNLLNFRFFYSTHDYYYLALYLNKNEELLKDNPDPDDYDNQIKVLRFIGKSAQAEKLGQRAIKLFPWDKRFNQVDDGFTRDK